MYTYIKMERNQVVITLGLVLNQVHRDIHNVKFHYSRIVSLDDYLIHELIHSFAGMKPILETTSYSNYSARP